MMTVATNKACEPLREQRARRTRAPRMLHIKCHPVPAWAHTGKRSTLPAVARRLIHHLLDWIETENPRCDDVPPTYLIPQNKMAY